MKQFFLAISISVLVSINVQAQAKPTSKLKVVNPAGVVAKPGAGVLKSLKDSFSYALGMNIANNLKMQGIENINDAAMQKGLNDVFKKKAFLLNEQQANMCIQQTIQANMGKRNEISKAKEAEMMAAAKKTAAVSAAFLGENKKRPGVITLPDGLQYEILRKGDSTSQTPKLQDTFVVHYAGTLINGEKFDNSYDRGEPLVMPVAGVIPGWTEILQLMHIGDKWKVFIPSELGYGDRGAGAGIPGGSALVFEMELMGIKPAPAKEDTPKQN
ncbi:MAG: FKBP-type peptidyl-prolyl cis-trans isomerase [Ferruginibacter sp.]